MYFRQGQETFLRSVQTGSEVHTASYLVDTEFVSQVLKQLGSQAAHSPQSTVQVKNPWSFSLHVAW
jgi:hypothetical protein